MSKISAPAVSRHLSKRGFIVTPNSADLSVGGIRVSKRANGDVLVSVTLGTGLQDQEKRFAAILAEVLNKDGYEASVNSIDASSVYVSKGA